MNEKIITFQNSLGIKLCGVLSHPDFSTKLPLIVACHGFASGKNNKTNRLLLNELSKSDEFAFFRFDFMGHYDSEGDIAEVTISQGVSDLKSAITILSDYLYLDISQLGLFGASFGGSVVLWYSYLHDKVKAIALKAPISDYAAVRIMQLGEKGIAQWKKDGYQLIDGGGGKVRTNYDFYLDSKKFDTYSSIKDVDAQFLIIHGTKDDNAPLEQSVKLKNILGDRAKLIKVEGAGHGFKGEGQLDIVIIESINFFRDNLLKK